RQKPVLVDRLMIPPVKHDLKLMSIGFFLDDNEPLMWRGPMLHRALEQFLQDVHWGELDVLLVDMPPGTGDVSISLGQMLPRAEAIVVTTPQALAQEVASRAAAMALKTGMQLVGVVENMTSDVFGHGGGERLATQLGVRLLGRVPLDVRLRESADAGVPLVLSDPDSEPAEAIAALARTLDASVDARLADPPEHGRLVVCDDTFPTGMLGYWVRRLADGGLVGALTATSPRRLGHPDGGPKLTGTNPLAIAVPSSDGRSVVADVSMGNLTYGDVLAGRGEEDELAPFGGEQAHKAFA